MLRVIRHPASRRALATAAGNTLMILDTTGTPRNNFEGWVGTQFTADSSFSIHSLGRINISGNSQSHDVFLVDNTTNMPLACVTVDTSMGVAGTYTMVDFLSDLPMPSGTYLLVSYEIQDGDQWYEDKSVATASGFTILNSIFGNLSSGSPATRNNFTGKIGYKFHPSSTQTITDVGRFKLFSGDSGSHTVSIYDGTGTTVLASASISNSGQPMASMVYASLSVPLVVVGGVSYIIVTDETNGGDWFMNFVTGSTLSSDFVFETGLYNDGSFHTNTTGFVVGFKYASGSIGFTGISFGLGNANSGKAYVFPNLEFH